MDMSITRQDINELLQSSDGRATVLAAVCHNRAKYVAEQTGLEIQQVLVMVGTLAAVGLIHDVGGAMDELVELVRGTKRNTRFDLLRDKLVLALIKSGKLDMARANQLLTTQDTSKEQVNG